MNNCLVDKVRESEKIMKLKEFIENSEKVNNFSFKFSILKKIKTKEISKVLTKSSPKARRNIKKN